MEENSALVPLEQQHDIGKNAKASNGKMLLWNDPRLIANQRISNAQPVPISSASLVYYQRPNIVEKSQTSFMKCPEKLQPNNVQDVTPVSSDNEVRPLKNYCDICNVGFSTTQSLWRHRRRKHWKEHKAGMFYTKQKNLVCLLCDDFKCSVQAELIDHYNSAHGKNLDVKCEAFEKEDKFIEWKADLEKRTSSLFIIKTARKGTHLQNEVKYYSCNRSGYFKRSGNNLRSLKKKGSCKVSGHCSAYITMKRNKHTGYVTVDYCGEHVGHDLDPKYLKLSPDIRNYVASALSSGVNIDKLLENLKEEFSMVGRDALISRRDILNIRSKFITESVARGSMYEQIEQQPEEIGEGVREDCTADSSKTVDVKNETLQRAQDIIDLIQTTKDPTSLQSMLSCLNYVRDIGHGIQNEIEISENT
uniref:uncharacterized protein LOC778896 n=1 Tax=Ciona intestinalis TaxID=7719 RepID=UPI000180BF5B|nr:uncharacterized protein LOC778896 [Ciona intestinalis]|eukprot:XP_004227089.1 uncharacterized protein LOC778896 [Ciona intestinalis]